MNNQILVCHVEYPPCIKGSPPHKSYEFIDTNGRILLKNFDNGYVRPLCDGKPVDHPLGVGDIGQVLFGTLEDVKQGKGMFGVHYKILDMKTIAEEEFEHLRKECNEAWNEYEKKKVAVNIRYDEKIRTLQSKRYKELPDMPQNLEDRLVRRAYAAIAQ